jgi:hypothetical protein
VVGTYDANWIKGLLPLWPLLLFCWVLVVEPGIIDGLELYVDRFPYQFPKTFIKRMPNQPDKLKLSLIKLDMSAIAKALPLVAVPWPYKLLTLELPLYAERVILLLMLSEAEFTPVIIAGD